ncbi:predicted protein [Scheffersomyces stipitis CBS 6054]|uniref:Tubulin-folding cofactor D ARM repeats domain-containing protein n=1 Tax=Scheffersomyces stipitis (strain ATCC 58785 / CBS 6054 / NBRC 10063 / NRRL Y-11545) TaxID=322104 RepID=A3LUG3_PICST|nr:predicted protein [Scheffersomyces stipitis CBS 6054]ABN66233.2 predicted protein [Scheffersomyces stipitis CBS 6054]
MDDSAERDILKRNDRLHKDISSSIDSLVEIARNSSLTDHDKKDASTVTFQRLKLWINEFEPSPKLLDIHLAEYIDKLTTLFLWLFRHSHHSSDLTKGIGATIYELSKIRGFKFVTNFFSSDLYLVGTLIDIVSTLENDNEKFLGLIWLSNLVLVPFRLLEIDSEMVARVLQLAITNLKLHSNASKNQLVASILLSRLVTRSDTPISLRHYMLDVVEPEWQETGKLHNESVKLGHLMTINKILKRPESDLYEPYLPLIYELVCIDLLALRQAPDSVNNLNITYLIKILSKLSKFYIHRDNYDMVAAVINNLLHDIMDVLINKFDTNNRYAMAKALGHLSLSLSHPAINYQHQLIIHLIKQLELPLQMDTFSSQMEINSDNIFIPKYHTILLFLGYIALNKSMPLEFVNVVLTIVHKTLFIRQYRLTSVVGTQLRDTSCFVIWAISRMLKPANLVPKDASKMMETIFVDLVKVSVFDEELLIRRCGMAVLQEYVGRFGSILYQYSSGEERGNRIVSFIQLFNSQSIKTIRSSYEIILQLLEQQFDRNIFIGELLQNSTDDSKSYEVRKLSATYLRKVLACKQKNVIIGSDSFPDYGVFDFVTRFIECGNLTAACEVLDKIDVKRVEHKLVELNSSFSFDFHRDSIEKAIGYLRLLSKLVEGCNYKFQESDWTNLLDISRVRNKHEELIPLFKEVIQVHHATPDSIALKMRDLIKSNNLILSRTTLHDSSLSKSSFETIFELVYDTSVDCEIRANMVSSLDFFVDTPEFFDDIRVENLLHLLDDYTITNQGDVGSKVRLATLGVIKQNFSMFVKKEDILMGKLLRLSGELIDKIRISSFELFLRGMNIQHPMNANNDIGKYYSSLFTVYLSNPRVSTWANSFWKGVCYSIGATAANRSVINESFHQLLKYLESGDRCQDLKEVLLLLNTTTSVSDRQSKGWVSVLNVFVKLFECNYRFPSDFPFESLYVKCYNLHINTKNSARIGAVMRIFLYLILSDQVDSNLKSKVTARLLWICCNHRFEGTRELGSSLIFELANEIMSEEAMEYISAIDWKQSPAKLKIHITDLQRFF